MPKRKTTYLETTEVPAARSIDEIRAELLKIGARSISTAHDDNGNTTGLSWTLMINKHAIAFALPARVEPVHKYLLAQTTRLRLVNRDRMREKAERIAWRQLLRWVQIQGAMITCGMAASEEVFMPYALAPGTGQTMFAAWKSQLQIAAPAGESGRG